MGSSSLEVVNKSLDRHVSEIVWHSALVQRMDEISLEIAFKPIGL